MKCGITNHPAMKYIIVSISIFLVGFISAISAQTATEAFLLSQSDPLGTARNLGTGNSMFAIGPDFSAIGSNPSGLAGFRRSEFLLSAGLSLNSFEASISDTSGRATTGSFSKFNLPNLGFVVYNQPRGSKWTTSNWAIGINRVADFNEDLAYEGRTAGTITDAWRENASGLDPDDLNGFEEGLAYEAGAIYDFENDRIYETDYQINGQYALFKKEALYREGGKTELFLAYAADFDNKVSVGVSIGMPFVSYTQNRIYEEIDGSDDGVRFFNDLEYDSYINTSGYGLNGKIGVTVKPVKNLNLAVAFHSPTRLSLTDDFFTNIIYDYTDPNHDGPIRAESPNGSFQYALRTPWSASGGIGYVIGQAGFIAVHAKFTDYASMKYDYSVRGNGNQYQSIENDVNADIRNTYGSALQLNFGGEAALEFFRLRGGVTLQQSAFNNDKTFDPSLHLGAGYRGEYVYFDLGYKLTKREEGFLPYKTVDAVQPLVVADYTQHQLIGTVGFKF